MINHTALVCMPRQAFFLPHPSIQTPILNRFRQMLLTNILRSIKIGNRPRDFENARVAAGGEAEALGDELEEAVTGFVRLAMFADEARRHLGVTVDATVAEAFFLNRAAGFDAQGDHFRGFGVGTIDEITILHCRDFNLDVDAVKERAGDFGTVALHRDWRAGASMGAVAEIAAGAGMRVPFPAF